jgi:sulfide dehydrogenase cytochrome subunit
MDTYRCAAFTLALIFSTGARGQDLAAAIDECEACHGKGGVSTQEDIPSLAGRPAEVLFEALEAFYYYERHCTTTTYRQGDRPKTPLNMCNVANTLSAEDKKAIAEHFAGVR